LSGFRKLDERAIHQGYVISVGAARFEAPDGSTFERDVVHHPGAVSVVAVDDDGRATLVRQFRAPLDDFLLEIPAGKRDVTDEPPELTAARELEEEVGLRAEHWELLCEFHNSPGFCDEHSFVFLATGLSEGQHERQGIEEDHLTIEQVALADVPSLIAGRELVDAKSIIGLLLARERLGIR
jgi:8-oxo-dGTP pyrophosphatase MutT (NUDIX family)